MADSPRQRLGGVAFTIALILLVGYATVDVATYFGAFVLAGIGTAAFYFHVVFPGSRFFSISLANSIAVYACVFVIFMTINFPSVDRLYASIGFILPIIAFFGGTFLKRDQIRTIVTARQVRAEREFPHTFRWLAPMALIGASTFIHPKLGLSQYQTDIVFLAYMATIAVVVFFVSHQVSTFLIDTGLIFEAFFERAALLAVPTFAFLTFYSLNVIVFAAIYRIADRLSDAAQFMVHNAPAEISFVDAIYFSLITVSTVGYGDVTPASDTIRVVASVQIIIGVLLLLFGFYEIMRYSREHLDHHHKQDR
jgi:voltage-gated potassium channel